MSEGLHPPLTLIPAWFQAKTFEVYCRLKGLEGTGNFGIVSSMLHPIYENFRSRIRDYHYAGTYSSTCHGKVMTKFSYLTKIGRTYYQPPINLIKNAYQHTPLIYSWCMDLAWAELYPTRASSFLIRLIPWPLPAISEIPLARGLISTWGWKPMR